MCSELHVLKTCCAPAHPSGGALRLPAAGACTALRSARGRRASRPPRARSGFSLVELMVVFVLIGLLAGLVTVNVRGSMIKGKQNAARAEIASIRNAVEQFYLDEGRYPTNAEGLAVLAQTSSKRPQALLTAMPQDPWGNPYQYNSPGRNSEPYEIISFGGDGKEGGDGADADLVSWNLKKTAEEEK